MEKMMTYSCRCLWGTLGYTQWLRPCTSVIQSVILDLQQPLRMYSCLIQRPGEIKPTQLVLQPTPTPAEAACQAAWLHHWQPQTQASRPVRAALRPICLCVHAFSCGEHECNCVLKRKKCSCVCVCERECSLHAAKFEAEYSSQLREDSFGKRGWFSQLQRV